MKTSPLKCIAALLENISDDQRHFGARGALGLANVGDRFGFKTSTSRRQPPSDVRFTYLFIYLARTILSAELFEGRPRQRFMGIFKRPTRDKHKLQERPEFESLITSSTYVSFAQRLPGHLSKSTLRKKSEANVLAEHVLGSDVSLLPFTDDIFKPSTLGISCADPGQLDVKREILKVLLCLVTDKTRKKLMLLSEARKLWATPAKLCLDSQEFQRNFCAAVLEFQRTVAGNHPMIKFGNISTLRLSLFSDESLVQEFAKILGFLRIQDLGVHCNNQGDFMKEVVSMWAPALQGLLTFRGFSTKNT